MDYRDLKLIEFETNELVEFINDVLNDFRKIDSSMINFYDFSDTKNIAIVYHNVSIDFIIDNGKDSYPECLYKPIQKLIKNLKLIEQIKYNGNL